MKEKLKRLEDSFFNSRFWNNRIWDELSKQKVVIKGLVIIFAGFYLHNILPTIPDKNDPTGIFNIPLAIEYLFLGAGVMYMICNAGKRGDDWL